MAEFDVLVLLTTVGVLVQVTTNVPSGPMATRGWFCKPGACTPGTNWSTWNWLPTAWPTGL